MFENNERLITPPEDATIWRYMGFSQFVSILETKCLHFSRPDQFSDPFEGQVPRKLYERLRKKYNDPNSVLGKNPTMNQDLIAWIECVNCWYLGEHESDAMWKLYLKNDQGIAIRSTYKRLIESFGYHRRLRINVGLVKYIDFETDDLDEEASTLFIKRNHFEHERELRAVVYPGGDDDFDLDTPAEPIFPEGRDIPVDLKKLIDSVYVSPARQAWFDLLVHAIVKRYGYSFPIRHSAMAILPSAYRQTTNNPPLS